MMLRLCATLLAAGAIVAGSFSWVEAQRAPAGAGVAIDADDIGGVVTSAKGPEGGVWVIAETRDLPTKFVKIVVTDDRGRYVVPDLPSASYQVFVRGYGLVDSPRMTARPGQHLDLSAVVAPDPRAAAEFYPANSWLSLAELPKGALGDHEALAEMKECMTCHQVGDRATRTFPPSLGTFPSSLAAWDHRVRLSPVGGYMSAMYERLKDQRRLFADWTDRIAAGAYPREAPRRPAGLERNLVLTLWDWGSATSGRSDATATDRRHPTINANGLVYGAIQSGDIFAWLDPRTNAVGEIKIPSNAPKTGQTLEPSPYWGIEEIWLRASDPRSVEMDQRGRLWVSVRNRAAADQPAFCRAGSSNAFARNYPMNQSGRQVAMYDPATRAFSFVDTCFSADHTQFLNDPDNTLVYGSANVVSWIDTAVWEKTHDPEASQGWCPAVLDTNGDGKITEWTEPNDPIDPKKDHRIQFSCYQVTAAPDGALWCSASGQVQPRDDKIVRIERGAHPPQTCKAEVFMPPTNVKPVIWGSGGSHVDTQGVVWTDWRGSDHVTSFDRAKCKVTSGPKALGNQCPEGWTTYHQQGATFKGLGEANNADVLYLTQVDTPNALGLGEGAVITGLTNSDELLVVVPQTGKLVELRVPYPMGFLSRSSSGRIDDPKAGWKGRGLWSNYSSYTPWHMEGGKGTRPPIVKFQVRPDPLAK